MTKGCSGERSPAAMMQAQWLLFVGASTTTTPLKLGQVKTFNWTQDVVTMNRCA